MALQRALAVLNGKDPDFPGFPRMHRKMPGCFRVGGEISPPNPSKILGVWMERSAAPRLRVKQQVQIPRLASLARDDDGTLRSVGMTP